MNAQKLKCACGHPVGEHSLQGQCKHKEMGGDGRMHHVCKCALGERETVLLSAQRLAAQAFIGRYLNEIERHMSKNEIFEADHKRYQVAAMNELLRALGLEVGE